MRVPLRLPPTRCPRLLLTSARRRPTALPAHSPLPAPSRLSSSSSSSSSSLSHASPLAHSAPFPPRTHSCAALTAADAGQQVVLAGWILPERKASKSLSFIPLKDARGTTQLVLDRKRSPDLPDLSSVPVESVVLVRGHVRLRPDSQRRPRRRHRSRPRRLHPPQPRPT
ncbi:hypothetical protein OF83DRAFT_223481 [Amylostereum chailletii]|nr:hypothetical protein OF83DRAFT_223481 [Amylostereum chailletii]